MQAWYDEVKDYNFSYGGFAMNTGHFTQLVWRETVKVQSFDIFVLKLRMAGGDGPLPLW